MALFTAALTAFYMTRLYLLTFFGEERGHHHPHESPPVMGVPLMVLAIGALVAGVIELPHLFHMTPLLSHFLEGVVPTPHSAEGPLSELGAMAIATAGALLAIGLAWLMYGKRSFTPSRSPIVMVMREKFWVDEFYHVAFVSPFQIVSGFFSRVIDPKLVDGFFVGGGKLARFGGTVLGFFQWGAVQFYLWVMAAGAVVLFWAFLRGWIFQ